MTDSSSDCKEELTNSQVQIRSAPFCNQDALHSDNELFKFSSPAEKCQLCACVFFFCFLFFLAGVGGGYICSSAGSVYLLNIKYSSSSSAVSHQGSNSWMMDSNRMMANRRLENAVMQARAKIKMVSSNCFPVSLLSTLPPLDS